MGIFVRDDGYYQNWLAGLLCCCAALGSDEHPAELSPPNPTKQTIIPVTHEQPPSYSLPPYSRHPVCAEQPSNRSCSAHDSLNDSREQLKPPSPFFEPLSISSRPYSPSTFSGSHAFLANDRRVDRSRRQSLIPLKLAPVVLRERVRHDHEDYKFPSSGLADPAHEIRHQRFGSDDALLPSAALESYRQSRESPFQRLVRRSTDALATRSSQQLYTDDYSPVSSLDSPTNIALQLQPPLQTLQQQQSADVVASTADSRSSGESSLHSASHHLKRKRPTPATLRLNTPDTDIHNEEGIELNTIVEKRKQHSPTSTLPHKGHPFDTTALSTLNNHIPAVAPSMEMHVRSETLTDIGSAFSRPLTARSGRKNFDELLQEDVGMDERRGHARSRSRSQAAKIRSRSGSRVSGWLSSIRNGSNNSVSDTVPDVDRGVYLTNSSKFVDTDNAMNSRTKSPGRLPKHSHPSFSSIATNSDTPQSMTTASSPVSAARGHNRSMTTESRFTSPPSTVNDTGSHATHLPDDDTLSGRGRALATESTDTEHGRRGWPTRKQSRSQVGLAL